MDVELPIGQSLESMPQPARAQLLLTVTNAVVRHLDLRELARATGTALREAFRHDVTGIALYDPDTNQFRAYYFDLPEHIPPIPEGTPMPLEGTVGGLAYLSGRAVFMNRYDLTIELADFDQRLLEAGVQSGGVIPLIAHGCKLGFLGVGSFQEDAFSESDQELLVQVANQIALAVENALNFQRAQAAELQAQRHAERTQLLLQVTNAIASALDLPSLFQAVSGCLRQVFRHDYAVMGLYDDEQEILRVFALDRGDGIDILQEGQIAPMDDTPVGLAIRTKQAVVTGHDYLQQFPSEVVRRAVSQGIRANCSVPLIRKNRVIGAMSMASRTECAFTQADGELFLQIAGQVAIAVENALAFREIETLKNKLNEEKLYLEEEIQTVLNFEQIIGASAALQRILRQVETVAPTGSTVLIRGETGTGKELIARAIHNLSERRERTLVKLNCAAIPTGLLESELFGHEKGAFTGAIAQRIGRFELANKGTLFLDEVGDIPLELQPKLLRVLQEQEFERLGSGRTQRSDVRL
ncbi:MAG TPA: sigma 54-interacting transcriptional regulator, partial [Blastocatellia bacterium]|nr:sigma 54-interacting transcriptional regulator [Blastocatellia bacterium]